MSSSATPTLFARPVFEIWRSAWCVRDGEMAGELARADVLITRRREGYVGIPIWPDDAVFPPFLEVFKAFDEFKPNDLFWVSRAEAALDRARPLFETALWPRWSYLERAFDMAARTGDLVAAALVLREMCNELTVLEGADTVLSASWTRGRSRRLHTALGFVVRHLAPGFPAMSQARKLIDWSPSTDLPEPEDLLTTYQRLCDYVHPNYGSHLAFAFPERSSVGKVLVQAVITIYERFLARAAAQGRPHVEESLALPTVTVGGADDHARFVTETLPWLDASPEQVAALSEPSVRGAMLEGAGELVLNSDEIASDVRRNIGELWDVLDPASAPHDLRACIRFVQQHPQFAHCPALADWESLLHLRRSLAELEVASAAVPAGLPAAGPYDAWFQLVRASATAALEVTVAKIEGLRIACVRMLVDRNPVGAMVVARALLEQFALGSRVASRFAQAWERLEEAARSNRDLRPPMRELEQQLGRFLAGTRATVEDATRWRERWAKLGWMNLRSATDEALEALPSVLYERMTRFLKNDLLGGGTLFMSANQGIVKLASKMALDVLLELDPRMVALTLTSQMMKPVVTMEREGGPSTAGDHSALLGAVRDGIVPDRLVKDRDYQGTGTEADPFRFRRGLLYYSAFARLREQMGLESDPAARRTWASRDKEIVIGDVLRSKGTDVYFSTSPFTTD
jgi:hypothetical protein